MLYCGHNVPLTLGIFYIFAILLDSFSLSSNFVSHYHYRLWASLDNGGRCGRTALTVCGYSPYTDDNNYGLSTVL